MDVTSLHITLASLFSPGVQRFIAQQPPKSELMRSFGERLSRHEKGWVLCLNGKSLHHQGYRWEWSHHRRILHFRISCADGSNYEYDVIKSVTTIPEFAL